MLIVALEYDDDYGDYDMYDRAEDEALARLRDMDAWVEEELALLDLDSA
jgi:hypothetical protein